MNRVEVKGEYCIIADDVEIGEGTSIWNYTQIMSGTVIGKNCKIGSKVHIGPNVQIGNNVKIQNGVDVFEGVVLEDDVFVGPHVCFSNVRFPKANHVVPTSAYFKTLVCKGASIGANCTIICGAKIGENNLIAAGCTVLGNQEIPDNIERPIHGYPIKEYPRNK